MIDPEPKKIRKGKYRHYKNKKLYEVIGVAQHTETDEQMVVYRPLYETETEFFTRPYEVFTELVELDGKQTPRFEKVED